MTNKYTHPALKLIANSLPKTQLVVLSPTNAFQASFRKLAQQNGQQIPKSRPFLNSTNIIALPTCAIVGPAVGAPASVLSLEPFLQQDETKIMIFGTCGGIPTKKTAINIGDIVLPRGALSEEGTSKHYGGDSSISFYPGMLQSQLETLLENILDERKSSAQLRKGSIWTTDAPYKESPSKALRFANAGAIAVDMEFSAVLQLCKNYQAELACAMVVSDIVAPEHQSGFRSKAVGLSLKHLATAFASILQQNPTGVM